VRWQQDRSRAWHSVEVTAAAQTCKDRRQKSPLRAKLFAWRDAIFQISRVSDQRTLRNFLVEILPDLLQYARIAQSQRAVHAREHAHAAQPCQRFIGVHEGESERVGDVLLAQRKQERFAGHEPQRPGTLVKHDDQRRGAFGGGAPAGAQEVLVDVTFFTGAEPGDVESESWHFAEQSPDFSARQQAELHFGQCLDAMLRGVKHGRLQADEISWQEEIQNLAAAVGQRFEAERPAGIERVDFRAVVAGADDFAAGRQDEMVALDFVDGAQLLRGDGLE
jgi:hypothetical protein